MKEIKVQKLTREAFNKYGDFQNLFDDDEMMARTFPMGGFHPDLIPLDFDRTTTPTVNVCHIYKKEQKVINFIEYHMHTCEGLLPIDDDVVMFVGLPENKQLSTANLEAFYVPKGTFVRMNSVIIHGVQFPVNKDEAHCLCLLPARTFVNDCIAKGLEDDEKVLIVD